MPINFIPNDPMAGAPAPVTITPSPDRSVSQSRFTIAGLPPQGQYSPSSYVFIAWQAREAALRTLAAFEEACGPLPGWEGRASRRTLKLEPNAGSDINAYYNRNSISFFEAQIGAKKVYSGASTDVVAHETGHAILDALRPDFWDVSMIEVAAFHEGFGDCVAVMSALSDRSTRDALLAGPGVSARNFVEGTAEELSDAIRRALGPNHNAAAPRRALNHLQWALPQTLPGNAGPGVLINESHSLGQIVSGIYYDLIAAFYAPGARTQAGLWTACKNATRLIVDATMLVQVAPRFFESWGRTMLAIDHSRGKGANGAAIKGAFLAHGIAISAAGFLAPQAALATGRRKRPRRTIALTDNSRGKLREVLRLDEGSRFQVRMLDFADGPVAEVASDLRVDLTGLSERLANVVTHVPRPVLVGEAGGTQALLGVVPSAMLYSSEVRDFVETLVAHQAIEFEPQAADPPKRRKRARAGAGLVQKQDAKTHAVVDEEGTPTLKRISFACGGTPR
jgi:hypothetical protein